MSNGQSLTPWINRLNPHRGDDAQDRRVGQKAIGAPLRGSESGLTLLYTYIRIFINIALNEASTCCLAVLIKKWSPENILSEKELEA